MLVSEVSDQLPLQLAAQDAPARPAATHLLHPICCNPSNEAAPPSFRVLVPRASHPPLENGCSDTFTKIARARTAHPGHRPNQQRKRRHAAGNAITHRPRTARNGVAQATQQHRACPRCAPCDRYPAGAARSSARRPLPPASETPDRRRPARPRHCRAWRGATHTCRAYRETRTRPTFLPADP